MNKYSLQNYLKKEYFKFFIGFLSLFIFSTLVAMLFGLHQNNSQFCQSLLIRVNDLNEVIAREKLIGSDSTINFELKKLQNQFKLNSIVFSNIIDARDKANYCLASPFGYTAYHSVIFGTKKMGEINANKSAALQDLFFTFSFLIPLLFSISGALGLFAYIKRRFTNSILSPITRISYEVERANEFKNLSIENLHFDEFINLVRSINKMSFQVKESTIKIHKLEAEGTIAEAAKQVAHDIRSPLSALTMILGSLDKVSEDKRILIRTAVQRINDIANDLLVRSRIVLNTSEVDSNFETCNLEFLAPIVDTIVSEQRIRFREKSTVEIEASLIESYGIFCKINSVELKRCISNLINNSVEAFLHNKGRVTVSIVKNLSKVEILIQDNGKGIPSAILTKIGNQGFSHGKEGLESGSGLGLFHAKKTVEESGGQLVIDSTVGVGTTVKLIFQSMPPPAWFIEKLSLAKNLEVVSLDDDTSIHQLWSERFNALKTSEFEISHRVFTSGGDFKKWFREIELTNLENKLRKLYLVDFELLNQNASGLDIIEELGIGNQAILVTSRYDEREIRDRCEKLGVKLIPKAMAGFVPIEIETKLYEIDAILIDDDKLCQMTWNLYAKENNKSFSGFSNAEEFLKSMHFYDKSSPLFIDSCLGENVKGEEVAKLAFDAGFKLIYLSTGYDSSQFKRVPWIKDIIGKMPDLKFFK